MTSKDPGASAHALIGLIYRHLQENGYKKAASELKKHAPQLETANVNMSLEDIFKKWQSEEQERKSYGGKGPLTSSVPKPESATNAAHTSPKKKVKSQTPAAARSQKRKRTDAKTSNMTIDDSDSDSSLDVEKWKRRVSQLSDADIAKIDAFTNVSTSTTKLTRKRKPAQPRKKQDQTIGNGKTSSKKSKVKTANSSSKTSKTGSTLKPSAVSVSELDDVKATPNKPIIADLKENPENLSEQLATPKPGISNGRSKSNKLNVKRKKTHSLSESDHTETPSKEPEPEKTGDISEPKPTETPFKKTKSKKDVKVTKPGNLGDSEVAAHKSQCGLDSADLSESNSSKRSEGVLLSKTSEAKDLKKSKKGKIMESVCIDTSTQTGIKDESGSLTQDESKINQVLDFSSVETPFKKAKSKKSKKSKEHQEPEDVTMSSGESHTNVNSFHSKLHQNETLSGIVGSEPVEKRSKKAKKSLLEPNGAEKKIETQLTTSIMEPFSSEMPSKKSRNKQASETSQQETKAVVDVGEGEAPKSSSSKSEHNDIHLNKRKRKRKESSGESMAVSVSEHVSEISSGLDNSFIPAGSSIESQGQESVPAVEVEGKLESKMKKKKKKDKEKSYENDENVEEVPPAEEKAESPQSSQKKKKKKKHRDDDDEVPSVSTPAPEDESPKKKKKSSKEKEHADVA